MAAGPEPLVVWINGAFGVGKTAVAEALLPLLPGAILFDPEQIGFVLRDVVPATEQTGDFQDIPAWRAMTRAGVVSLAQSRAGAIVVPMTVVETSGFDELVGGVRRSGVRVVHVTLTASADVVAHRLLERGENEWWALARVERCVAALADDRFAVHLDAQSESSSQLAARVAGIVREAK